MNLYAYCSNNPVRYYDPTGHAGVDYEQIAAELGISTGPDSPYADIIDCILGNGGGFDSVSNVPLEGGGSLNVDNDDSSGGGSAVIVAGNSESVVEVNTSLVELLLISGKSIGIAAGKSTGNGLDYNKIIVTVPSIMSFYKSTNMIDQVVTTRLTNPDFVSIIKDSVSYYGGDQEWFTRFTQAFGGCGPTAAANILAYMALTQPNLEDLYTYDKKNVNTADFTKFMEEVYKYVTPLEVTGLNWWSDKNGREIFDKIPPSLGITSVEDFANGVERYAKSKGIKLSAVWSKEDTTFNNAVNYIRTGLEKDRPVALLNMFDKVDMLYTNPVSNKTVFKEFSQHWVTITGMIENESTGKVFLEASSWGGKAVIGFNELWDCDLKSWHEGLVYFDNKK